MLRLQHALASAAFVALGVAAFSCLAPTEILLDVRTNIPCTGGSSWQGVAISVGSPGVDVESRAPVLTTTACSASGEIGTLVVVPTGSDGAAVGIRVVAGITQGPETCAAKGYAGCVVSRRTLTYLAHETQNVVVELTSDCIGNACDLNHTCIEGACADTVTAQPPVSPDGGVVSGPTVRCGDDGTRCPVSDPENVCCVALDLDAGTGKGTCTTAATCPSTSAVLYCDDDSDCPPTDAGPAYCVESSFSPSSRTAVLKVAACTPTAGSGNLLMCQERQPCPTTHNPCNPSMRAPGYFDCQP